jgi:hypothetical protein
MPCADRDVPTISRVAASCTMASTVGMSYTGFIGGCSRKD